MNTNLINKVVIFITICLCFSIFAAFPGENGQVIGRITTLGINSWNDIENGETVARKRVYFDLNGYRFVFEHNGSEIAKMRFALLLSAKNCGTQISIYAVGGETCYNWNWDDQSKGYVFTSLEIK